MNCVGESCYAQSEERDIKKLKIPFENSKHLFLVIDEHPRNNHTSN